MCGLFVSQAALAGRGSPITRCVVLYAKLFDLQNALSADWATFIASKLYC